MVDNSQAYKMTAAMMQIRIPVASPPRNAPTSVAAFGVSGSLASRCPGAMVGLGLSTCGSEATVGPNSFTRVSCAMVVCGFSTGSSGIEVVGLGPSNCNSGVDVGLGCGSGMQEGVHTLTMVAV